MRDLLIVVFLLSTSTAWATSPSEVPEDLLVEQVTNLIMTVHQSQPECGRYCTSTRSDRDALPDWSDSQISETEARYMAEAMVWTSTEYDVPLDEVLATAFQESSFRYMAIGGGTECGMYQQTTQYFRWEAYDDDHPVETRDPGEEVSVKVEGHLLTVEVPEVYTGYSRYEDAGIVACVYLLNPYNAGWQFALKYHNYVDRWGEHEWSRFYNGGPNQWNYAGRHRAFREQFAEYLDDERDLYLATLREQVDDRASVVPVSAHPVPDKPEEGDSI